MHYDGARSIFESRARVDFTSSSSNMFPFSFHLEFDCTNNMAKNEAMLLCFEQAGKIGIKLLKVIRESKL